MLKFNKVYSYKGCKTTIKYIEEDDLYFGKLEECKINGKYVKIKDLILFEGKDIDDVCNSFKKAVDDYYLFLKAVNEMYVKIKDLILFDDTDIANVCNSFKKAVDDNYLFLKEVNTQI